METVRRHEVLIETALTGADSTRILRQALLVAAGVAAMVIAAQIKVPMWPVPVTMQTFVVLTVGAAYGLRLGAVTMLAYLLIGAIGFDVFTGSSASDNGLAYMIGGTGGYLAGYPLAAALMGWLARRGWDRDFGRTALALLAGNALIYVPGLAWLGVLYGWNEPILEWGLYPFLLGDGLKLVLAAMLLPAVWRLVGRARG